MMVFCRWCCRFEIVMPSSYSMPSIGLDAGGRLGPRGRSHETRRESVC